MTSSPGSATDLHADARARRSHRWSAGCPPARREGRSAPSDAATASWAARLVGLIGEPACVPRRDGRLQGGDIGRRRHLARVTKGEVERARLLPPPEVVDPLPDTPRGGWRQQTTPPRHAARRSDRTPAWTWDAPPALTIRRQRHVLSRHYTRGRPARIPARSTTSQRAHAALYGCGLTRMVIRNPVECFAVAAGEPSPPPKGHPAPPRGHPALCAGRRALAAWYCSTRGMNHPASVSACDLWAHALASHHAHVRGVIEGEGAEDAARGGMILAITTGRKRATVDGQRVGAGGSGPAWIAAADALGCAGAVATAEVEAAAVTCRCSNCAGALLAGLVRAAGMTATAAIGVVGPRVDLAPVRHRAVAVGKPGHTGVGARPRIGRLIAGRRRVRCAADIATRPAVGHGAELRLAAIRDGGVQLA